MQSHSFFMITDERIKQIKKQLRTGEPQGEIKNKLRSEGYLEEDIEKVFLEISAFKAGLKNKAGRQESRGQIFSLIGISFLIVGITIMGTDLWVKAYAPYPIVLGISSLVVKFIISSGDKSKKTSD